MIRRPPKSTQRRSSAASDVYKRQVREPGPPGEPRSHILTTKRISIAAVRVTSFRRLASTRSVSQIEVAPSVSSLNRGPAQDSTATTGTCRNCVSWPFGVTSRVAAMSEIAPTTGRHCQGQAGCLPSGRSGHGFSTGKPARCSHSSTSCGTRVGSQCRISMRPGH